MNSHIQSVLLVGLAAAFVLVGSSCDEQWGLDPKEEELHYDVYDSLQDEDWPVYAGPCIMIQAPSELQVFGETFLRESYVRIYDVKRGERSLLLWVNSVRDDEIQKPSPNAMKLGIGGMDTYFYQQREEGRYSGKFEIELPLALHNIVGGFEGLTASQRDLVFRIITSIRLDVMQREVEGEPKEAISADLGEEFLMEPVGKPDTVTPVTDKSKAAQLCL